MDREEIAYAMGLWREGERLLQQHATPGWREDYAQAAARALAHLAPYSTVAELVIAYFDDAASGDKERWLVAACRTESGRILNEGIVEDAAFWRRAQELIAASQGRG